MLIYFLRRLALTVPTFIALMFLTFVAIRMVPGDPVEVRVGEHGISPERLAYFRHELGLDQPVWKQFVDYAWRLVHGDFGVSLATQQKVLTEFLTLFPATLELSFFAMLFAICIGVPSEVELASAASRRSGWPACGRARPGRAGVEAIPRLRLASASRRFRRLARDAAESADRVPDAVPGDAGAFVLRDAVRHMRRVRRRARRGQPRRRLRSGADDDLAVRLFHADILVGPAADHVCCGGPRLDARFRAASI